jgi:hypothetical protein
MNSPAIPWLVMLAVCLEGVGGGGRGGVFVDTEDLPPFEEECR